MISPEDREKRIEAAIEAMPWLFGGVSGHECAARILAAADRAVPVISAAECERAEAAARDFAKALRFYERVFVDGPAARVLAAHRDFAEPSKPSKPDEEEQ